MSMKVDAGGLLATATGLSNITNASDVICYLNYGKKCLAFYLRISPWHDVKALFVCRYTNSKRGMNSGSCTGDVLSQNEIIQQLNNVLVKS